MPAATASPTPGVEAAATPPPEPAPSYPQPWPGDPHATVLAELPRGCVVRGVADGSVYVQAAGLHKVPVAGGAPARVHADEGITGSYGVAHGRTVFVVPREQGLATISLVAPDGSLTLLEDGARATSWAIGPDGVYWGDNTYTEPALFRVPFSGGGRLPVETLRPVGNEDRIEELMERDGDLVFVARRTHMGEGRGYSCDELRGGRVSRSRTLWRGRTCSPRDGAYLHVPTVGPGYVYFWRDRAFRRVPRRVGREEVVTDEAPGLPQASWSDDRVLLWLDWRGLVRLGLGEGARPELLGQPAWVLSGIEVADGRVYWTRRQPGEPCLVMSRPLEADPIGPAPDR